MSTVLNSIDLYGQPYTLHIDKESLHTTSLGGIATILQTIYVLAYGIALLTYQTKSYYYDIKTDIN